MTENKKAQNVGHSTNLTIGGKTYKSTDISRLTPQTKEVHTVTGTENAPRDVSKVLKNEAGTIKTDDLDHRQSPLNSSFTAQTASRPTMNVQTETERTQAAQDSAKSYTAYYNSTNVRTSSDMGLTHEQSSIPQNVQGIKTNTGSSTTQQTIPLPKSSLSPTPTPSEEKTENSNVSRVNIIASKAPTQGASLGAAYFTTLAAGHHNSLKSNIDTSNIKTSTMLDKAAEARAAQAMLQGSYTPSHIIKNTGIEAKASFYEAMGRYSNGGISLSQNVKSAFSTGGSLAVGKAQGAFANHDDMGSQVASGAIATGTAAYAGFKLAQTASPMVINAVQNLPTAVGKIAATGKGVWDVTTTAGKATVTLAKTAQIMSSGFIPFNAQFTKNVLLNQAQITGLLHTATSQHIISGVRQIQTSVINMKTAVVNTAKGIQTGVVTATNAVKRSYTLVRGVVNGSVMSSVVAHQVLQKAGAFAKTTGLKGLKLAGQGVARGAVKGGVWTFKRGLPNAAKGIGGLSMGVAGVLTSSNDMMLQGAGNAVMLTNYGIKTSIVAGRTTGRVVKTSVKGGVKAAKGTYKAINFVRQKGLRAAWARARNKTATAIANAGKSVVTAVVNLVKSVGSKVIVPIILIAVVVSSIMSIFAAPAAAVGGIFSGLFDTDNEDGTYTETDIRAFITDPTDGIPAKRTAYINDLYNYLQDQLEANGGGYDYVRFKTNTEDTVIEPTVAGITSVFYTEEELANIIQPIFNAIILKDYELAPTDREAKQVLTEIFDKLFRRTESATIEYCGQSAVDGSGTAATHTCGSVHAADDCPNPVTGTHTSYTCSTCCYYYCNGHKGSCTHSCNNDCAGGCTHTCGLLCALNGCTHTCGDSCEKYCGHSHSEWHSATDSGCYSTTYCSGCIHACNGYTYCGGHDVLTVTLNMDGLYQLLYEYFEQPIDVLANKTNRTEEEERELANLKDYYEICLEYIRQVSQDYGGGLTMEDLSGVQWVNGSRVGNQAIIDLALSQVGQVGGQPYWSWYGFSSRVEWCACFVSWCMNQVGHSEVRYASCQYGGVPYFSDAGRWASGGYTDLVAGDVIFFDWDGDGTADHTGLVIGTDGTSVYTVEGNSGDTCKTKKYALNSSVILGYGLMNW